MLVTSFGHVSANSVYSSKDIVEKYKLLEKTFLEDLANSEWVHVNVFAELGDDSTTQMENWYHQKNGLTFEVFEWATINDGKTENYQEGLLKEGVWFNITYNQMHMASSPEFELDLTSGFGEKLFDISAEDGLVSVKESNFNGLSAYMFSYLTKDGALKEIESYERRIYLDKFSGRPLGSEIYQNNTDGSIILIKRAIFEIKLGVNPPTQKLDEMKKLVEEKKSSFQWSNESDVVADSKAWYQTSYRAENVVVSGLTVRSYKTALPYDTFWKGNMYTGTPDTILQEVGATWFSFQERCGSFIYNTYISTTPSISTGSVHWFQAVGITYYEYDDCSVDHKVFVNGTHHARYNNTNMIPSPDFTIWMPVP